MKFSKLAICLLALCAFTVTLAQGGRATTEATINGKKVTVSYGQPQLKGRDLFGQAPVGTVWRLGRNEATTIESTGDLVVGGTTLKAGKYTLWAVKTGADTWVLKFHPKTMNGEKPLWGQPEMKEGYVGEIPLSPVKVNDSAEDLKINLSQEKGQAVIVIHWGTVEYKGSFGVA